MATGRRSASQRVGTTSTTNATHAQVEGCIGLAPNIPPRDRLDACQDFDCRPHRLGGNSLDENDAEVCRERIAAEIRNLRDDIARGEM